MLRHVILMHLSPAHHLTATVPESEVYKTIIVTNRSAGNRGEFVWKFDLAFEAKLKWPLICINYRHFVGINREVNTFVTFNDPGMWRTVVRSRQSIGGAQYCL